MKSSLIHKPIPERPDSIDRVLARAYPQLVEWSDILTRGDKSTAEEIVQDLCLHLTMARPDIKRIENLEAYLFKSLRNMYLSHLARASRARLRTIHLEDFDAVVIALNASDRDSVDLQNELLRICEYSVWRKQATKSASQFILLFFWGYDRSEVARIARLPISAIYNKLKEMREEVRAHVQTSGRLRIIGSNSAPSKEVLRSALPSDVFFRRLRGITLDASDRDCLSLSEWMAVYAPSASPVPLKQLAHLAGCESCLGVIESILNIEDRQNPLDEVTNGSKSSARKSSRSFQETMRTVQRRRTQLLEERPTLLAIGVDGTITAFHDVVGSQSSISCQVEQSGAAQFVEVFNQFGHRLAYLPIEESASSGPISLAQFISFSDDRWLRFELRTDGAGLRAEAIYSDPALESAFADERINILGTSTKKRFGWLSARHAWVMLALTTVLVAGSLGVLRYRHPAASTILLRSNAAILRPTPEEAVEQTFRLEVDRGGKSTAVGTLELWHMPDRTVRRRLTDLEQRTLATEIESENGSVLEEHLNAQPDTTAMPEVLASGVWKSDMSTGALHADATEAVRTGDGFELTEHINRVNGMLKRTLLLDRGYEIREENLQYTHAGVVREVRFIQTSMRRVSGGIVPSFRYPDVSSRNPAKTPNPLEPAAEEGTASVLLPDLEMEVLYTLFRSHFDVGQPIAIHKTQDRVILTGTIDDPNAVRLLRDDLAKLHYAQFIQFDIRSTAGQRRDYGGIVGTPAQELVSNDEDPPAASLIRERLGRGQTETALKETEKSFETTALSHVQVALQHAYALQRLGTLVNVHDRSLLSWQTKQQWAEMAETHGVAVRRELQALDAELNMLSQKPAVPRHSADNTISTPEQYVHMASELLHSTEQAQQLALKLFAQGDYTGSSQQAGQLLETLRTALPIADAQAMSDFTARVQAEPPRH